MEAYVELNDYNDVQFDVHSRYPMSFIQRDRVRNDGLLGVSCTSGILSLGPGHMIVKWRPSYVVEGLTGSLAN